VDELVVRLEEVIGLALVGDGIEPPVAIPITGHEAVEIVGRHAQIGEVRALGPP